MKAKDFHPTHYILMDDYELLYVMIGYSKKHAEEVVFSVIVDSHTKKYIGSVVESRIKTGFDSNPCFIRHRTTYYLSWLKPLRRKVDK